MKALFIIFTVLMSLNAFTQESEIVGPQSAVIETCDINAMGCVPHIRIGDETIVLDRASLPSNLSEAMFGSSAEEISIDEAEGIIVMAPSPVNPTVTTRVFKLFTKDQNAVVEKVAPGVVSGAAQIVVHGERTLIDQVTLTEGVRSAEGLNISVSVKGYYASEKGHFPNPTVYFRVFRAIELNVNDIADVKANETVKQEELRKISLPEVKVSKERSELLNSLKKQAGSN